MAPVEQVTNATGTLLSELYQFGASHESALLAAGLACGIIICFAGRVIIRPFIFLLGSVPTAIFVAYVTLALFEPKSHITVDFSNPSTLLFIAAILGLVCGIGVGWITLRVLVTFVIFALSVIFGALTAAVLCITILHALLKSVPDLIFYGVVVVTSLISGFLSLSYVPLMLILSTSFDGALMACFFFGQFLGGFPDPLKLNGGLTAEEYFHAAAYVVLILVLGAFGVQNQLRIAQTNGVFREEEKKSQQADAVKGGEKEPLLGELEKGEVSPLSKTKSKLHSEFQTPESRYTTPRVIGAAPLYENGNTQVND